MKIDQNEPNQNVSSTDNTGPSVVVVIPCFNEAITIGKVCDDFRRELPDAEIYVYDNNSSDQTAAIAAAHGAILRSESRQGKGYAMRQAFREFESAILVMVDGDDTYPAEAVHELLAPVLSGDADLVLGDRLTNQSYASENKRYFHSFGNDLVRWMIKRLYGTQINDAMTGYRVMTEPFVKCFPMLSNGFEIEVEMDIEAIDKHWRVREIPVEYRDRPEGSFSKLSTVKDGAKVLRTILGLFKNYKPLTVFSLFAIVAFVLGLLLGIPVVIDYLHTGLVGKFPTAILAVGLCLTGLLALTCGLILDTIVRANQKQYELVVLERYQRVGLSKPLGRVNLDPMTKLPKVDGSDASGRSLGVKR